MRGQAVHEKRAGVGGLHHTVVDLEISKVLAALGVFFFKAHRGPDVRGDKIGALGGFNRITRHRVVIGPRGDEFGVNRIALGDRKRHMKSQDFCRFKPGVAHVVRIPDPGNLFTLNRTAVLHEGHDVGHDLHRVIFIGKAVNHRHLAVFCKRFQAVLPEGADHHQIDHAADDARRVFDGFRAPELRALRRQIDDVAAELIKTRFKGNTRAGACLFKDHREHFAAERFVGDARFLQCLDRKRAVKHVVEFVSGKVGKLEKVSDRHGCSRLKNF